MCIRDRGSSLYQGQPSWNKQTSIKVQTKTLATVLDENNIDPAEYDFLNIDAEGSELDILKGYERYLEHVNVIDLETSYDDRHLSGASHDKIASWLSERGFELREQSPTYDSQQWGDSVFVRVDRELPLFVDGNAGNAIFGEKYLENSR